MNKGKQGKASNRNNEKLIRLWTKGNKARQVIETMIIKKTMNEGKQGKGSNRNNEKLRRLWTKGNKAREVIETMKS